MEAFQTLVSASNSRKAWSGLPFLQLTPSFSSNLSSIPLQEFKRTTTTPLHQWTPDSSNPRRQVPPSPRRLETQLQSPAVQQLSSRKVAEPPSWSPSVGGSSPAPNGNQPETPKSCLTNEGSSRKRKRVSFAPGKSMGTPMRAHRNGCYGEH